MYDELIKRLRWCASYDPRIVIQDCNDAADAIEELSEERDMYIKAMADEHNRAARLAWEHRWIPVTEQLPEDRKMVLATVNGVVRVAFYGNYMWEEVETYSIFYPTHWMPIPQVPESEGE